MNNQKELKPTEQQAPIQSLLINKTEIVQSFSKASKASGMLAKFVRQLTQANCLVEFSDLCHVITAENVATQQQFYSSLASINTRIKQGGLVLECFPHGGRFKIAMGSANKIKTGLKVETISVEVWTKDHANKLKDVQIKELSLKKEKEQILGTTKKVDHLLLSTVAVQVKGMTASDQHSLFLQLANNHNVKLTVTQEQTAAKALNSSIKANKQLKDIDK